jgi:hypothetical protein
MPSGRRVGDGLKAHGGVRGQRTGRHLDADAPSGETRRPPMASWLRPTALPVAAPSGLTSTASAGVGGGFGLLRVPSARTR